MVKRKFDGSRVEHSEVREEETNTPSTERSEGCESPMVVDEVAAPEISTIETFWDLLAAAVTNAGNTAGYQAEYQPV